MLRKFILSAVILLISAPATANLNEYDPWGIAMGFRIARIPYPAAEQQVSDVIPLLFFDNKVCVFKRTDRRYKTV